MHCILHARTVGATLAFALCSAAASATVITFDALERAGTYSLSGDYQEAGFQVTRGPTTGFAVWGRNNPAYTGSAALMVYDTIPNGNREPILTKVDGGAFSLESIDFSEWSIGTREPFEILVSARLNGAWVWNYPVFLDGVFGNETFNFGSVFSNSLALVALGLVGLAARRRGVARARTSAPHPTLPAKRRA